MCGTIHLIIFAATVDIHTGDGSIITQIPSGMSWDIKGLSIRSKTDYKNRVGGGQSPPPTRLFPRCESEKNYRPGSAFVRCICHVLYAKYRI